MDVIKVYCSECKNDTNHNLRAEYKPKAEVVEEKYGHMYHEEYFIKECLGCNKVSFLHREWDSSDIDSDGTISKIERQYPEDINRYSYYNFLDYDSINELPRPIYDIYEELKTSLENDADILAGVGMRMVVEAVCIQQKIPGRSLKDKISKLYNNGILSKNDFEIIDALREIGNISAHKIKSSSQAKIIAALEATNHLLRTVYIVSKRTKRLKRK